MSDGKIRRSSVGEDSVISGSKIAPMDSQTKTGTDLDPTHDGSIGTDDNLEHSKVAPLDGGVSVHAQTAPHSDSQGVIGRDNVLQGAKIDPLSTGGSAIELVDSAESQGLDDETVDAARIEPMGSVKDREERPSF